MNRMNTATKHITTAEQLLAASGELGRCELFRGELRMMAPSGGEHGDLVGYLHHLISRHVFGRRLGRVYGAETGFVLERNPDTVRAPDVAFIANDRLAEARTPKFIPIPPDFAAEVLSPDDRASGVAEKTQWWLDHGVKLLWVVDPGTRTVAVHRPDGSSRRHRGDDVLDGGEVLPGPELPVRDIFES